MLAAARTVVAFGIIMQAAGFAKLLVIADYFGAAPTLDAYYLGTVIPTFLAGVSSGILQTAFVPAYVRVRARGEDTAAVSLGNVALTWTALTLSAVAVVLTLARGLVVPLLAHGTNAATHRDLQAAFVPLLWTAPINAVADGCALLLNAQGRFAAAAGAPLLNAVIGTIVLVALRGVGVDALVWSLVAGVTAQATVVLIATRCAGVSLRPQVTLPRALPRLLGTVALPVVLSMVLGNLVPAFVQTVSGRAGAGAISAMGYASRLHNSLVQAVVISVSTVLLPHFARLIAEGRNAVLRHTLERVFAAALLFAVAALVLVAVSGPVVVHLLLQRGNFSAANAQLVAKVWLALTAGLLGATWGIFLARVFQAQQRLWFIFLLGCVSVIANIALALAFLPSWGVTGVALANSAAYLIVTLLCHLYADRLVGRTLTASTVGFVVRVMLVNLAAYWLAVWFGELGGGGGAIAVFCGQLCIVMAANLLVARSAPLSLSLRALLGTR